MLFLFVICLPPVVVNVVGGEYGPLPAKLTAATFTWYLVQGRRYRNLYFNFQVIGILDSRYSLSKRCSLMLMMYPLRGPFV